MKTSIFILFVGLFSYGYCQSDPCDPLAANIAKKPEHLTKGDDTRSGDDHNNQYIDMAKFLANTDNTEFVVGRASHRKDITNNDVCSVVSFGEGCGPIRFTRKIIAKPDPVDGNYYGVDLKGKVKMETKTWTLNLYTLKPVGITMTTVLVDGDDLIFQVEPDSVKFHDLETGAKIDSSAVSENVKKAILSKFAIHHIIIDGNEAKANVAITCDEKYAWATYTKKTVDDNLEGKYALTIENLLKHLDIDHRTAGQKRNEYDVEKVKPLSTAYPKQYRDKEL